MSEPSTYTPHERLWIALSDLFLDTEVRWSLPYIARVAIEEGFSWSQVCHILDCEVTPVLAPNLYDIAGEWAGFPEDWLLAQLHQSLPDPEGKRELSGDLYDALESVHSYLSQISPVELRDEESRLSSLLRLCLEPVWSKLGSFWTWTRLLARCSTQEVERSFQDGVRPFIFRQLIHTGDASSIQLMENWGRFRGYLLWLDAQESSDREDVTRCCEELAYLYTVPELARVPRGVMVLDEVSQRGLTDSRVETLLREPLGSLYGDADRALKAWKELRVLRP